MPRIDSAAVINRVHELLAMPAGDYTDQAGVSRVANLYSGALSISVLVYGAGSPQVEAFKKAESNVRALKTGLNYRYQLIDSESRGVLQTIKSEVQQGLVSSIQQQATGTVLAELLSLAKEKLDDRVEVAAVLAAAAFEDTIRRMGETLAGVTGRPKLESVLLSLKSANVLVGPAFTTAQGYLTFRNHALHADWSKLNGALVGSLIAFVEGLVLQHFS